MVKNDSEIMNDNVPCVYKNSTTPNCMNVAVLIGQIVSCCAHDLCDRNCHYLLDFVVCLQSFLKFGYDLGSIKVLTECYHPSFGGSCGNTMG